MVVTVPEWRNRIRTGFKNQRASAHAGSSPASGTHIVHPIKRRDWATNTAGKQPGTCYYVGRVLTDTVANIVRALYFKQTWGTGDGL